MDVLATALPPGLTSLALDFAFEYVEDLPAPHGLQYVSALTALEQLTVSGCLRNHQAVPAALSRLTFLVRPARQWGL